MSETRMPSPLTGSHLLISEVAPRGAGTGAVSDSSEYMEIAMNRKTFGDFPQQQV